MTTRMLQGLMELPKEILYQIGACLSPKQIANLEAATKIDMDVARVKHLRRKWVKQACFNFRQRYRSLWKQMQKDNLVVIRGGDICIHPDHHKTLYDLLMEINDIYNRSTSGAIFHRPHEHLYPTKQPLLSSMISASGCTQLGAHRATT